MVIKSIFFIAFVICFSYSILFSQNARYKFEQISVENGLSSNDILCILQDSKGFLWIGTENGLNRYDGYNIKEYKNNAEDSNSISSNHILCLYEDPADNGKVLWIGTKYGGLNRYNQELETFTHFEYNPLDSNSLSYNAVRCIYKDSKGIYWIGTGNGGLNEFDPLTRKFKHHRHDPYDAFSLISDNVSSVCEDHLGNLWVGTEGRGLSQVIFNIDSSNNLPPLGLTASDHWITHPNVDVWEYDPRRLPSRAWLKKADMPAARWNAASYVYNKKMYILGGIGMYKPPDTPAMADIDIYDPQKNSWENLPDMPLIRAGHSVNQVNGKIIVIGGYQSNWSWGISGNIVEEFDPETGKWTRKKNAPVQLADFATAVLDNKIYVVGGSAVDMTSEALKTLWVYDPSKDHWTKKADMNTPRTGFGAGVIDGKIYVFGGMRSSGGPGIISAEVYNPNTNRWSFIRNMPEAKAFPSVAVINRKVLVLGGVEKFRLKNSVFAYDPGKNIWKRLPDMPLKRAIMAAGIINGKLYIAGGTGYNADSLKPETANGGEFKCIRYRYNRYVPNSINTSYYNAFYEDKKHILWMGTGTGLRILDREKHLFIPYSFQTGAINEINSAPVLSINEDQQGNMWIATWGQGIFRVDPERKHVDQFKPNKGNIPGLSSDKIRFVLTDRSGIVWIATSDMGLNKLTINEKPAGRFRKISTDNSNIRSSLITALERDEEDNIWIGTSDGYLDRYDPQQNTFKYYHFDTFSPIRSIAFGDDDAIWLSRSRVLTKFYPINGEFYNYYGIWLASGEYMPDFAINWIKEQLENKNPIASINKVKNSQQIERTFNIKKKTEVLIVAQGEIELNQISDTGWLTRETDGKTVWKMERYKTRRSGNVSRNRIHISSLILSPGTYKLHFKTDEKHAYGAWADEAPLLKEFWGVSVFNMPAKIDKNILPLLSQNNFMVNKQSINGLHQIHKDRTGNLWCVMAGQVYIFDENNREFILFKITANGKLYENIDKIFEDHTGNLWFAAADHGLFKQMNPEEKYSQEYEIKCQPFFWNVTGDVNININQINSIFEDTNGYLWIANNNGLTCFNPQEKTFRHYTENNGLASNIVMAVTEDQHGNLWLSGDKGLTKFNPLSGKIRNYKQSDGLPVRIYAGSVCKEKKGNIYFGSFSGLVTFHPDSLDVNTLPPPVVFTDFLIFNKSVLPGDKSLLKESITHNSGITLPYDQNVFTFEFAALDYTDPKNNRYGYKMEGIDPDWVYTTASRRFATYTSLNPGEYIFTVKATNNDGIWNNVGTSVRITVTPPWWRTTWAYLLYILLVLIILYSLRQYDLKRQQLKHQLVLEKEQAEKLLEIDHMKSRFFANISHEFRTPLTLILGPIKKILDNIPAKTGVFASELKDELSLMQRNAWRLYRLINQLLDLSKLEAGGMTLQIMKVNIVELICNYAQSFESLAKQKGIRYVIHCREEEIVAYVDQDKIEQILNNLLSNAFKSTAKGGEVQVTVVTEPTPESPPRRGTNVSPSREARLATGQGIGVGKVSSNHISIKVSDTGVGIPPNRVDKIFDRFYQVDDSQKREHEGTGIGLALVKELVKLHHGHISVQSEPGKGSTFTVSIPLGKEHFKESYQITSSIQTDKPDSEMYPITEPESVDNEIPENITTASSQPKPIILVVEDNADMRTYICNYLKSDYKLLEANNGAEGVEKAQTTIPDLIISDVMMPKMDGYVFCTQIKSDEKTSHIPVILLTARAAKEDKLTGLETGADDYVAKPFESDELKIRVKNLIEQRILLRKRYSSNTGLRPEEIAVTSADKKFLIKALQIIEQNMSDPEFGVDKFRKEIALSRVQLHRKLHALTDQSTSEFVRSVRLNRAAQLLKQNADTITQIAYEVGFKNPSYFSSSFQKQFGVLPKEYIRQQSHSN